MFFLTLPSVAEGFLIRTWQGGPHKGEPKLSSAAQSLLDRRLARLDRSVRLPRLFLTPEGVAALRRMMADPRKFAHIRRELGIDPPAASAAG